MRLSDELSQLTALHTQGHLSDEQYAAAKRKLLAEEIPVAFIPNEPEVPASPPPPPEVPGRTLTPPVVDETGAIRRYRDRGAGALVVLSLGFVAIGHLLGIIFYGVNPGRYEYELSIDSVYSSAFPPWLVLVVAVGQASGFLILVVLAYRQPYLCGRIGLVLFLGFAIGKTAISFYDAHHVFAQVDARVEAASARGEPLDARGHEFLAALREKTYDSLYRDYGVGWAFRAVVVVMLVLGIRDARPGAEARTIARNT